MSVSRLFRTLALGLTTLALSALGASPAAAQVGVPSGAFGPGLCSGGFVGFSPTFFGNHFDANFPPLGCKDGEAWIQQNSKGAGIGIQRTLGAPRTVVGGSFDHNPVGTVPHEMFALSAYDSSGDLDPAFGAGDGKVLTPFLNPSRAFDIVVRDDDSIVAVGGDGIHVLLAGYQFDGTLAFQVATPETSTSGAQSVAVLDGGLAAGADFVVVGTDVNPVSGRDEILVARFDAVGNLVSSMRYGDAKFGTASLDYRAFDVFFDDQDQMIYVAGEVEDTITLLSDMIVLKLDPGLSLDGGFGGTSPLVPAGGVQTVKFVLGMHVSARATGVAVGPNRDVYLTGTAFPAWGSRFAIARIDNGSGAVVGQNAGGPADAVGHEMAIDARNRITIAGQASGGTPADPRFALMRYSEDLVADIHFGSLGTGWEVRPGALGPSLARDIVLDEANDEEIVLAGSVVIDPSSAAPWVTHWNQTASRWVGGPVCGNGILELGEDCESPFGVCCTEWCSFRPATTLCRGIAGDCDVAEMCSGASDTCPADAVSPAATVCRASVGTCDATETCDGVNTTCPVDGKLAAGTICRATADVCDAKEVCDGATDACPADEKVAAGTECRGATDVCDAAESCDGILDSCPADGRVAAGTICRATADVCDAEEVCDGVAAGCPADGVAAAGTTCRAAVNECDVDEECDGFAITCPADALAPAGTPAPTLCDDGEACTADVCDGAGGCDNSGAATSAGIDYNEDGTIDAADDVDTDTDGIIDACDICVSDCNPDQLDTDADCSATAPWNASSAPECGDVCDVCPASDEVAMAADPDCAAFDYNSSDDCCEETGAGLSVGPAGESCGAAGTASFTSSGANGSASVQIPAGAVDEDTSFSADSKTKGGDEFFVRGGGGRYVSGYDFGPEGVDFDPAVTVCMTWNDADDDGFLERSEGYDYRVTEANIAPYHVDSVAGEYKLADKCSLVPCVAFDGDGFPTDWGGHTRYDEASTATVDESLLGACCGATENRYCFQVYHFSTYALADPNCADDLLDRTRLKVVKIHKPEGEQKVIFKTDLILPVDGASGLPDPAIDPITNGVQISVLAAQDDGTALDSLWSAVVEGGGYDPATRSGWKSNRAGTSFLYKARDRADGIIKVQVKKKYSKTPGLVQVKVVAKDAAVALPQDTRVLQAEVSLDPQGFLDRCAMTGFATPPTRPLCSLNGSGSAMICR